MGQVLDFLRRAGGMLVAPGAVRRELLAGGPGGFSDLMVLLALQMCTVHITRIVRSVWLGAATSAEAALPGLTQVALGVLIKPLMVALGGSVLLRIVTPEGKARERTLDQAALCAVPSVVVAVAAPVVSTLTAGASRATLGNIPMAAGMIWSLALLIHFALEARRERKQVTAPAPQAGARISRVAGWATALLLAAALAINVAAMARDIDSIRPVTPGALAPAFSLGDLKDRQVSLEQQRGKAVLISFWATWCAPCLREMPFLERLQGDLGARGLRVLAVNVEPTDEVVGRLEVVSKRYPRLTILRAGAMVANRYGVQTLPHLVMVDQKGRVAHVQVGAGDEEEIKKKVGELLKM